MILALALGFLDKVPPKLRARQGAKSLIIAALGAVVDDARRSGPRGCLRCYWLAVLHPRAMSARATKQGQPRAAAQPSVRWTISAGALMRMGSQLPTPLATTIWLHPRV